MIRINALTKSLLREETLIGTTLSHFHAVEEARKLSRLARFEHPVVSFGKKAEDGIAFGQEITQDTLSHARIRVSPAGKESEYRYFKRIHAVDGTRTRTESWRSLSASAWVETDARGNHLLQEGTCHLRLCYPGFTGNMLDIGAAHTRAMYATLGGAFHQTHEVGAFLSKTMENAKAMDVPVGGAMNTSWSMGAANALASSLYFKHRGIPSAAILGDAWGASASVQSIAQDKGLLRSLFSGSHAEALHYPQSDLRRMLKEDVASVYPAVKNATGGWTRMSTTAPARMDLPLFGKPVGRLFHIDTGAMAVLKREVAMGDTHHRANIINHLATHDAGIMHELQNISTEHGAGHGVV